jgi:membrane-associated protease RseP (regulator of RpoE activity)
MVGAMGDRILDLLASIAAYLDQASALEITIVVSTFTVIGLPLLALAHELGHAIAVRLRGLPLETIVVGDADDLIVRAGALTMRFGRMTEDDGPGGFVRYDATYASARDIIVIALAGPLANLAVAPVLAGLALIGGTSGPLDAWLWLLSAASLALAVANLVPLGRPGTSGLMSDGRVAQVAWARRDRPVHEWIDLDADNPASHGPPPPAERHTGMRWPFAAALFLVVVLALAAGGASLLVPLLVLFGAALLQGGHRRRG